MKKLFPPAREFCLMDDDPQSLEDFIEYGSREPNSEGTGRWNVTTERHTIKIIQIGKLSKGTVTTRAVASYLKAMLGGGLLETKVGRNKYDYMVIDKLPNVVTHDGYRYEAQFIGKSNVIEVFSLFDVLVNFVEESDYCVVALTSEPIGEGDNPDDVIVGRACGDRVCVVSTHGASGKRDNLITALHETGHTMGLDHCVYHVCVMAAICANDDDLALVDRTEEYPEVAAAECGGFAHFCPVCTDKLLIAVHSYSDMEGYQKGIKKRKLQSKLFEDRLSYLNQCKTWFQKNKWNADVAFVDRRLELSDCDKKKRVKK